MLDSEKLARQIGSLMNVFLLADGLSSYSEFGVTSELFAAPVKNWDTIVEPLIGSTGEAAQRVCRLAKAGVGAQSAALYRRDGERWHRLYACPNHPAPSEADQLICQTLVGNKLCVIEDVDDCEDLDEHPWVLASPGLGFLAAAPLWGVDDKTDDEQLTDSPSPGGLLVVSGVEPTPIDSQGRQLLIDLAGLADELLDAKQARHVAATAKREFEAARAHSQQLVEELSRSNRQLEQFAYVASHDLQEPLRMVTGFLGLLAEEYADHLDEEANEYIDFAVDGAKRMRHLINDLLTYSRVFSSDEPFVTVDAEQVFIAARDEVLRNHPETVAVVTHQSLPEVRGRRQQLQRLFSNLLSNALQYSKESPHIEVWCKERDDDFIFALSDDGVGVELDQQERIFQIFVRGIDQPAEKGTGIGLAICTSIVEAHGGRIWVESPPGDGATFYFTPAKMESRHE